MNKFKSLTIGLVVMIILTISSIVYYQTKLNKANQEINDTISAYEQLVQIKEQVIEHQQLKIDNLLNNR